MKSLPLYTERRIAAETTAFAAQNSECKSCGLCAGTITVCMPTAVSESEGPTLLVVGTSPTKDDDGFGQPMSSDAGHALRLEIEKRWKGKVVYTFALRCPIGTTTPTETMINACRPYLAGVLGDEKPSVIITLGAAAAWSVLGRKIHPGSVRGGYAYTSTGTPVYILPPVGPAMRNYFRHGHLMTDLERALCKKPPAPPPWHETYSLVTNGAEAEEACKALRVENSIVYDTEYSGPMHTPEYFRIDTLAACVTGKTHCYVWDEKSFDKEECLAPLRALLQDAEIEKGGHNIKVDLKSVWHDPRLKTRVAGDTFCTLIWRKLNDPDVMGKLAYQTELVGMGGHKGAMEKALEDARKTVEKAREEHKAAHITLPGMLPRALEAAVLNPGMDVDAFAYGIVASSLRSQYCALDTVGTSLLAAKLRPRIMSRPNLKRTWLEILKPASRNIAQVESWGFLVDRAQIENVGRFVDMEKAKYLKVLKSFGHDFNPDSPDQLKDLLYGTLGLPVLAKTDTGQASTNAKVLGKLKGAHAIIEPLLGYKEMTTMQERYAWGLLDHVQGDGRIHGSFSITGTKTGRFSSSNPNMQNIPSRSPLLAKMVKNIFTVPAGYTLIQIDFSQLEYRVAAILSGDPVMQKVFIDGHDVHRRTAELISQAAWNIPQTVMEGYTKEQVKQYRSHAKQVNFGTLYGLGAGSLADDLGISVEKARMLIAAIMGKFQVLDKWIQDQISFCTQNGFVHTYFDGKPGRWRPLWGIVDRDDAIVSGCRNGSINTPVQGSAAEYMTRSLNEIVEWILSDGIPAKVVCTVHDSALLEVRNDWLEDVIDTSVDIFQSWWSGPVPLIADVETGPTWGALEEWKSAA